MDSIIVNSSRTLRQYNADCRADILRENRPAEAILGWKHDREFVGKVIYVPASLLGFKLNKQDLRELVCK